MTKLRGGGRGGRREEVKVTGMSEWWRGTGRLREREWENAQTGGGWRRVRERRRERERERESGAPEHLPAEGRVDALLRLNEQLPSSARSSLHPRWAAHRRIRPSGPALGLRYRSRRSWLWFHAGNPPQRWEIKLTPEWIKKNKKKTTCVRGGLLDVEEVKLGRLLLLLHPPGKEFWDNSFFLHGGGESLVAPWDAPPAWFCWRGCAPSLRGTVATSRGRWSSGLWRRRRKHWVWGDHNSGSPPRLW